MNRYGTRIAWASMLGLLASVYALWVEMSLDVNADGGDAMCDISERISCSKVFRSKFGRGFGVVGRVFGENSPLNQPNGVAGVVFYSIMIAMALHDHRTSADLQMVLFVVANLLTVYLAYLSYFVLHTLCVVCLSLYVLNAVNLVWSLQRVSNTVRGTAKGKYIN